MNNKPRPLHLFEGYGVELEYMIVDKDTLMVCPITDRLIYDEVGAYVSDVEFGDISWSNELVLHVVELKTQGPAPALEGLHQSFQQHVQKINHLLSRYNAQLLPTGAHPFMDPYTETKLWQHEHNMIYEAYNHIFDCRGHGWANLQSAHLNLPFGNDEEFGKLHAAIRMVLPIIPAISASSPVLDGKITGILDTRLEVYRHNQDMIPSIAGKIIPERVFSKSDYEAQILQRIYRDISPYDKEGILQEEFLNSRGAIARFERNAIEIRLIDTQESPLADIAILQAIVGVLKALVAARWVPVDELKKWDEEQLASLLLQVVTQGQNAVLADPEFTRCFGFKFTKDCTVGDLWKHLIYEIRDELAGQPEVAHAVNVILIRGNLSTRILEGLGENPTQETIKQVYSKISRCLNRGEVYIPDTPC